MKRVILLIFSLLCAEMKDEYYHLDKLYYGYFKNTDYKLFKNAYEDIRSNDLIEEALADCFGTTMFTVECDVHLFRQLILKIMNNSPNELDEYDVEHCLKVISEFKEGAPAEDLSHRRSIFSFY